MAILNAPDDMVDKRLLAINSAVESKGVEDNRSVSISCIKRKMSGISPDVIDDMHSIYECRPNILYWKNS